ncbi:MAG: Mpv17/PMP22 family protein [Bacteroidales bacterium]
MKRTDIVFIALVIIAFSPFFISDALYEFYDSFNKNQGIIASFFKFAILATLGELIALRIREGIYYRKGFGVAPRAIVWGFIGITIKIAFIIFATGTPAVLEYIGVEGASNALEGSFTGTKLLTAFCTSVAMNLIFAPVFMTFHKITDTHIIWNGGTLRGFFTPINFSKIFISLDWGIQWNFVFKKTIPLFWIPAHTITFLLPPHMRVLFAAILGIVLGVLLAVASLKSQK